MRLAAPGAAFLDRDGTINLKAPEGQYIEGPDELVLLPGAARAVRCLNDAGVRVVVVTNQRGIALGAMTESDLAAVHRRLAQLLDAQAGARLDGVLHCPHERGSCLCRKPAAGMLEQALRRWPDIDLGASWMVGDAASDIEAGRRAGTATVALSLDDVGADHVAEDLLSAVAWLVGDPDA